METIGSRLKALRLERGLTLEQAGAEANTTKQAVSQIEKGITANPGGSTLYRWSKFYGVDLEWLVTGKGTRELRRPVTDANTCATREACEVARQWDNSRLSERLTLAMDGGDGFPKISQAALARRLGVKQPTVNDWRSGKSHSMGMEYLFPASRILSVNPEWLASGKGPRRSELPPFKMTPETLSAAQDILALCLRFTGQPATLKNDPEMLALAIAVVSSAENVFGAKDHVELAVLLSEQLRSQTN